MTTTDSNSKIASDERGTPLTDATAETMNVCEMEGARARQEAEEADRAFPLRMHHAEMSPHF